MGPSADTRTYTSRPVASPSLLSMVALKKPERLEAELKLILANGGDRLAVCNGGDVIKPGYREVFMKYTKANEAREEFCQ